MGAIRLDLDEDKILCHDCGAWFSNLAVHIAATHGKTAKEYKVEHGLTVKTSLVNEKLRIGMASRAFENTGRLNSSQHNWEASLALAHKARRSRRYVAANRAGHCMAQLLRDIRETAKYLKRTPTISELYEHVGVSPSTIARAFGGIAKALEVAGLSKRKPGERPGQFSRQQLLVFMERFYKREGRIPYPSDSRRGLLPSRQTYKRHFGSWLKALRATGLINRKGKRLFRGPHCSRRETVAA